MFVKQRRPAVGGRIFVDQVRSLGAPLMVLLEHQNVPLVSSGVFAKRRNHDLLPRSENRVHMPALGQPLRGFDLRDIAQVFVMPFVTDRAIWSDDPLAPTD